MITKELSNVRITSKMSFALPFNLFLTGIHDMLHYLGHAHKLYQGRYSIRKPESSTTCQQGIKAFIFI